MKVHFKETRVVDDHRRGTPAEVRFEAGREYDLRADAARYWINRGAAVAVDAGAPADAPAADATTDKPKKKARKAKAEGDDAPPAEIAAAGVGDRARDLLS